MRWRFAPASMAGMHSDGAPAGFRDGPSRGTGDLAVPPPVDEFLAVVLFEDAGGRLVVVDARCSTPPDHEPLLRIGRARIVLRHLALAVMTRLLAEGHVVVDGADALNVLLAFADELGRPRD